MDNLPIELVLRIIDHLSVNDIKEVIQVYPSFSFIVDDNYYWKGRLKLEYGISIDRFNNVGLSVMQKYDILSQALDNPENSLILALEGGDAEMFAIIMSYIKVEHLAELLDTTKTALLLNNHVVMPERVDLINVIFSLNRADLNLTEWTSFLLFQSALNEKYLCFHTLLGHIIDFEPYRDLIRGITLDGTLPFLGVNVRMINPAKMFSVSVEHKYLNIIDAMLRIFESEVVQPNILGSIIDNINMLEEGSSLKNRFMLLLQRFNH